MTDHRPWFASYPEDVPKTLGEYPERSVYSILEDAARRHPDRPAAAWAVPGGKTLTYRQLVGEVERFSAVLSALGVGKGDRVALILPNCPQYVIAYYATVRIGAVIVGNNPLYTHRELAHQLNDCGAEVVVVLDRLYPSLAAIEAEYMPREVIVTSVTDYMKFPINKLAPIKLKKEARHEGQPWPPVPAGAAVKWWKDLMKSAGSPPPVAEVDARSDPAGFIYTGGTTGLSKGAMLSHFNLVSNTMQGAAWFPDLVDGQEAVMCVLPFFHSYGMTVCMNIGLYKAAKLILLPRFELDMALKAIAKEKPTLFPGVPRLYIAFNEAEETRKYDLSSIRACLSGAAPLPLAVAEKFEGITAARVVEGYGLTETSPITHANPISGRRKEGSIGLPVPDTDCKLVDLDDPTREVEPGQEGELALSGPQIMLGYWNRPDETAGMIREDANGVRWLFTGDIAKVDEEGYFSIVDRKKDMILVSGFNVYPTDVEQVLYRHEAIEKVCVVGVPDQTTGEAVKAFVVLRQGHTATAEDIIAFAREGLTGYRVPKRIEFREALPETLVGKVLRRVLLEEEKQGAGASGA
ncbi:MAG: long-chain fatty acid--CoA ligase [Actinobacteria bacterium]|nr:long-chain fatty acid--CoA ligase [Actinomycetota bacterium]